MINEFFYVNLLLSFCSVTFKTDYIFGKIVSEIDRSQIYVKMRNREC